LIFNKINYDEHPQLGMFTMILTNNLLKSLKSMVDRGFYAVSASAKVTDALVTYR